MFAKVDVNGPQAAPFFEHLTRQSTKPKGQGKIGWNFEKFLINRKGEVVGRYGTGVDPTDPELTGAIETALKQKP